MRKKYPTGFFNSQQIQIDPYISKNILTGFMI